MIGEVVVSEMGRGVEAGEMQGGAGGGSTGGEVHPRRRRGSE